MATTIEALQNRAKLMESNLGDSSTAYAPNTAPTTKDLSTSSQLASINKQIEDLRSKTIRNQWYGPSTDVPAEGGDPNAGIVMRGLKALGRPLNAIVGAGQYALGKGTESSLTGNINKAMQTGLTSGDVLKQVGAPRALQIPLGFALDVMFDPVNWLTAGTAALIPRVAGGALKGLKTAGIEGAYQTAKAGLVSGVEKKAATALNIIPFAKKSTKYANLAAKVGERAVAGAEKYDSLMGKTVYDKLGRGIFGEKSGIIGNTLEDKVRSIPSVSVLGKATPTGDQIADFFKYSPRTATEIADLKDKVTMLAKNKGAILVRNESGANFQSIDDFLQPGATIGIKDKAGELINTTIKDADNVIKPEFIGEAKVYDSLDNAQRLLEIAGEDYNLKHLAAAYKMTAPGTTGVQWYDDVISRLKSTTVDDVLHARLGTGDLTEAVANEADDLVKNWNSYNTYRDLKPFQKLLEAQQGFLTIFKSAKVPMNVSSHVVANIGNFFMGAMMGLPVYKPEYIKSIAKSSMLVKGRLGAKGLREIFFNDVNSWVDFLDKNPNRFQQLTGMAPSEIRGKLSAEQKVMGVLGTSAEELKTFLLKEWDALEAGVEQGNKLGGLERTAAEVAQFESTATAAEKAALKTGIGKYKTASETLQGLAKEAPIRDVEMPGTWAASETPSNAKIDAFKKYLADMAEKQPYNPVARAANTLVNSMPRWYEHIDQSFKIGTTDYLSRIGLTEQELVTISRTVPITPTDLLEPTIEAGQKMYRLTPLKAAEVATEAYMNYSAMPDFVKVMRALPVVGSPFYSFPYAMAIKTAKTAISNPAVFNKIGFLMNEISGARSPQEKASLETKYNAYLKSPTVVKVFGMWNTDVKNFIPYYTMNMFNPSERSYDNSTQGQMLKMMDKFPVFQDPVGNVIKDFFIQPWVLSGSGQTPQGQFGQPLYPSYDAVGKKIDASLGTKAFYAGRTLAESLVPGSLGYAGLPLGLTGMSPGAMEYIPSYGARNLANAAQGRSSVGAMTKEDAVRKTLRSLLGRTGIPAYTLDTTKSVTK